MRYLAGLLFLSAMAEHFLPEYWFAGDPLINPADVVRSAIWAASRRLSNSRVARMVCGAGFAIFV
jgi:hypothetical protein